MLLASELFEDQAKIKIGIHCASVAAVATAATTVTNEKVERSDKLRKRETALVVSYKLSRNTSDQRERAR